MTPPEIGSSLQDLEKRRPFPRQVPEVLVFGRPLEDRIQELKEDVLDIEQTLHALPCFIDRDVHRKLMDEILKKKETDNA